MKGIAFAGLLFSLAIGRWAGAENPFEQWQRQLNNASKDVNRQINRTVQDVQRQTNRSMSDLSKNLNRGLQNARRPTEQVQRAIQNRSSRHWRETQHQVETTFRDMSQRAERSAETLRRRTERAAQEFRRNRATPGRRPPRIGISARSRPISATEIRSRTEDLGRRAAESMGGLRTRIDDHARGVRRELENTRRRWDSSPRWTMPKYPRARIDRTVQALHSALRDHVTLGLHERPRVSREQIETLQRHVRQAVDQSLDRWHRSVAWNGRNWRADFRDETGPALVAAIQRGFRDANLDKEADKYVLQLTERIEERGLLDLRPRDVVPEQITGPCNTELRRGFLENQLPFYEKIYGRQKARDILERSPYYEDPAGIMIDVAVTGDVFQAWYVYDPYQDRWVRASHLPLILVESQLDAMTQSLGLAGSMDLEFQTLGKTVRLADNPEEFLARAVCEPQFRRSLRTVARETAAPPTEMPVALSRELAVRKRWYDFGKEHPLATLKPADEPEVMKSALRTYFDGQIVRDGSELLADGRAFAAQTSDPVEVQSAMTGMILDARGFFADVFEIFH